VVNKPVEHMRFVGTYDIPSISLPPRFSFREYFVKVVDGSEVAPSLPYGLNGVRGDVHFTSLPPATFTEHY